MNDAAVTGEWAEPEWLVTAAKIHEILKFKPPVMNLGTTFRLDRFRPNTFPIVDMLPGRSVIVRGSSFELVLRVTASVGDVRVLEDGSVDVELACTEVRHG